MNSRHKVVFASVAMVGGIGLIGWNFRDKDSAYREPPEVERQMKVEEVPAPVQAAIKKLSAGGGTIEEIKEERQGPEVKYEVEIVKGVIKTEYELAPDGSILEQESKKLKRK